MVQAGTYSVSRTSLHYLKATRDSGGNLPAILRRSWNTLSAGFQLLALIAAVCST
jgi:hypothetical protein